MAASPNASPTASPDASKRDDRFATPLDLHVYSPIARPVARVVAALAEQTPVGPSIAIGIAAILGIGGASLLRYPTARQLVPGALLLVGYGIVDAAGEILAEDRAHSARTAHTVGSAIVCVACGIGAAIHVTSEPSGTSADAVLVMAAFGAVFLQSSLADAVRARRRGRLEEAGVLAPLLQRLFAEVPEDKQRELDLDAIEKAWGYLRESVHLVLFAVFVCADAMLAYAWLRIVAGTLLTLGLLFEQRRRMLALVPPAVGTQEIALEPLSPPPDKAAEEARAQRSAPISFRPPPPET